MELAVLRQAWTKRTETKILKILGKKYTNMG
jgi:hypothetical protein